MSETPNGFIDLQRRLVTLDEDEDVEVRVAFSLSLEQLGLTSPLMNWDELLASAHHAVVLGEAGAGKTWELRALVDRLNQAGSRAAFIRLDLLLDAPDLVGSLIPQHKPNEALFLVLDALDESKLKSSGALDLAIRRLAQTLGAAWQRVRLVISCRVSDWRPKADGDTLGRLLPTTLGETGSAEAEKEGEEGSSPSPVQVVALTPLNDDQVCALARANSVRDVALFLAALVESGARELASRPEDVVELASYWSAHGRIGSLNEVLEDNLRRKLMQRDERQEEPVSPADARHAVEVLAASLVLGRLNTLLLPDDGLGHDPCSAVDPAEALPGWSRAKIRTLLSRPVFDEATLGRVRFHHRSVTEFLAASWARRLLAEGCPTRRIEGFFVGEAFGQEVVFPSMVPVLAWLAAWDSHFRELAVSLAPEALLQHGDPHSLPVEVRAQILRSFASKFRETARVPLNTDWGMLSRFVDDSLSSTIVELFHEHSDNPALQAELLHVARVGQLTACCAIALEVAQEPEAMRWSRISSIDLIAEAGTAEQRDRLIEFLRAEPQPDRHVLMKLWASFFPRFMGVGDVLASIDRHCPSIDRNQTTEADYVLEETIIPACAITDLPALLDGLVDTFGLTEDEDEQPQRYWLAGTVCTALLRLLRELPVGELPLETAVRAIEVWGAVLDRGLHSVWRLGRRSAERDVVEASHLHPQLRRTFFWSRIPRQDRWRRFRPLGVGQRDLAWLLDDLRAPDCAHRLEAAEIAFWRCEEDEALRCQLREVVSDSPEILATLEQLEVPPPPETFPADAESARLQEERARGIREFADDLRAHRQDVESGDAGGFFVAVVSLYHGTSDRADLPWERIEQELGSDNAKALRTGLARRWRGVEAPRGAACGKGIPWDAPVGLVGLTCFFRAGGTPSDLNPEEVREAARYATWQLNEFPAWIGPLAQHRGDLILEALLEEIRGDFANPDTHLQLSKALTAPEPVPSLIQPHVLELLRRSEPGTVNTLKTALRALLQRPEDWPGLAHIASQRASDVQAVAKLCWIAAWLAVDPEAALVFLKAELGRIEPTEADDLMEALLAFMRRGELVLPAGARLFLPESLTQFLALAYRHIRPEDDVHPEGAHTPSRREEAQTGRNWQVQALRDQGTAAAYRGLLELRSNSGISERTTLEWFDEMLVQVAARVAQSEAWTTPRVVEFTRNHEATPRTAEDLFRLLLDRLEDVRGRLESGDFSVRDLFTSAADEAIVQRWLASELDRDSRGRYTVVREAEVDLSKKTDIRVVCASVDGPVTIEVKRADKWSYSELREALFDQLVGQYLRSPDSCHGVLFLASLKAGRHWDPAEGGRLSFVEMVESLDGLARDAAGRIPGVEALRVVGMDLTKPRVLNGVVR